VVGSFYMPKQIHELIDQGAIFYVSHSGGKDSQAMYVELHKIIPYNQLVVVHASLGDVEWPGVIDHIKRCTYHELTVVKAGKTLLEMVENRGMWPSAAYRQCTSDLKLGPIFKFIRNDLKQRGATIAINCIGLRTEESKTRAKREPLRYNEAESANKRVTRHVYDWLPMFHYTTAEIFQTIDGAGQKPFRAYEKNERLSCVFCIMGSINDLRHGAEQNPELYKRYVDLEKQIGHTMFVKNKKPISLDAYIAAERSK